jgi:hypothetical protein
VKIFVRCLAASLKEIERSVSDMEGDMMQDIIVLNTVWDSVAAVASKCPVVPHVETLMTSVCVNHFCTAVPPPLLRTGRRKEPKKLCNKYVFNMQDAGWLCSCRKRNYWLIGQFCFSNMLAMSEFQYISKKWNGNIRGSYRLCFRFDSNIERIEPWGYF